MEIGPQTKVTWPLLLGIIVFAVLATVIKRYFSIQNDTLWYAGVGAVAILIVIVIKKIKK
ncbi:MAG: hypothetical protein WCT53_05430 [Candidatus Gracilibacteria bacterium]|jgi:dolichyl-phosphate-mannose--protein O-mannosyl transferase